MGVPEPVTGPKVPLSEKGHVMAFLFFSTSTMSGSLLFSGRGDDLPYTTGVITERETHISRHVTDIALEVELHEGTRRFRRAGVVATLQNGQTLNLDVVALGPSIAMQGLGYSGGYNDGRGLGHPAKVILPDGTEKVHWHRIQPVSITADVEGKGSSGSASMTLTIAGQLPEHLKVKSDLE